MFECVCVCVSSDPLEVSSLPPPPQTWSGLSDRVLVAGPGGPVPLQHPRVPLHPAAWGPGLDQRRDSPLGPGCRLVQQHRLERGAAQL